MKTLIKICIPIFALVICLLCVEFATRIIFDHNGMNYGIEMWKYAKLLKQKSQIPELSHEHKPGTQAKLMGVQVKINSYGLRDHEYTISKPDETYRILVLGDSMTFGWGTSAENTYPKVLEKLLNQFSRSASNPWNMASKYEVINAGVGNYNTVQEVTYFKDRGIHLQPDMVLLGFYLNDAEKTPERSSGFLREHSYFYVLFSLVWDVLQRTIGLKSGYKDYYLNLYSETNPGWLECQSAIKTLVDKCQTEDIKLVIVLIPELHQPAENYAFGKIHTLITRIGRSYKVPIIDLLNRFRGVVPQTLWVSPSDPHPSAKAHAIMANGIYNRFIQSIIPEMTHSGNKQ